VEECLVAATDPAGEGARTFIRLYEDSALRVSDRSDQLRRSGIHKGPLMGLPISIKDLFNVAGETTTAGSIVLGDAAPARQDAVVVKRLRDAGAVLIGRTNMTEFAYSGLGLNPHFGTPRNPYDRALGRIPGGSSSGAVVSVSDGMATAAIGTDTGGSVRIPAALCGLTGFKPTARRVSLDGVFQLSSSLDSVGSIAPTVACCALLDSVLSGESHSRPAVSSLAGLRLGVLQGYVLDDLDEDVARCFSYALMALADAGAELREAHFDSLSQIPRMNADGGLAAAESYKHHRELIGLRGESYDPRVLSRILRGREILEEDYRRKVCSRSSIIAEAEQAFAGLDAWLMPTVPRTAPSIVELESSDAAYFETNTAMLRNPSVINFIDGCALSLPCHLPGDVPVGLMVAALCGSDQRLLSIAAGIEAALARAGFAIPCNAD
jgi:aspartyl-tRNA(Asn)/glutamyl-tRNA(Gln) amidotransferase subunit A